MASVTVVQRNTPGMATRRGYRGRWLAGARTLELSNADSPVKRGRHEPLYRAELLERQFAVTGAKQVWCGDVTYSVPGVQGGHGCLNEPRVCLEY